MTAASLLLEAYTHLRLPQADDTQINILRGLRMDLCNIENLIAMSEIFSNQLLLLSVKVTPIT